MFDISVYRKKAASKKCFVAGTDYRAEGCAAACKAGTIPKQFPNSSRPSTQTHLIYLVAGAALPLGGIASHRRCNRRRKHSRPKAVLLRPRHAPTLNVLARHQRVKILLRRRCTGRRSVGRAGTRSRVSCSAAWRCVRASRCTRCCALRDNNRRTVITP